jgi:hypothetical protein
LAGGTPEIPACDTCTSRLQITDPDFAKKWVDPLEVVDVRRHKTDCLRNLLAGRSAFLVCGGPSGTSNLHKLNRRGVFSLAINNVAGNIVRPQAFICSDPPMKFSHSIWMDPGVMKMVPIPKLSGRREVLREKIDGVFNRSELKVTGCPNVWGFRRDSWLMPDESFFTGEGACWGNQNSGVKKTGQSKTVCTMLLGFRMLRYLGTSRIFLVGVDFRMAPDYGYSFAQDRNKGASASNNAQFHVVNGWLCEMQEKGVFQRFGMGVYNTYENSGLRAFPYVPFEDALSDVVGIVEETPNLQYYYEKSSCPKCNSWHIKCGEVDECMDCHHQWSLKDQEDNK